MRNDGLLNENWYQVNNLNVKLHDNAIIYKQYQKGKLFYIIKEPLNNKFFQITPQAYNFITTLNLNDTVDNLWEDYLQKNPKLAPSQKEVIDILSTLHQLNLLHTNSLNKSHLIYKRQKRKDQKKLKTKLLSFLFIKIPIWNPEVFLKRSKPFIDKFISKKLLYLFFIVLIMGAYSLIEDFSLIKDQTEGFLSVSNIILLYITLAILKFFHELGHAMFTKKFGGEVTTMGIMFIVFTPLPYMDASNSWSFSNKYHRILVSSAGIFVELFFAAIGAMIWANTATGLIHNISFNLMVVGSVSSLVFNGNPLLKFDAYYMLSDYLEIPNLQKRSKEIFFFIFQKHIINLSNFSMPSFHDNKEKNILFIYGFFSTIYKFIIMISIALFLLDSFFFIGIIMLFTSFFIWFILPIYQFSNFMFYHNILNNRRVRSIKIVSILILSILIIISLIPFPYSIKINGVVQSFGKTNIYVKSQGILKHIYVKDGQIVNIGDKLFLLENYELFLSKKSLLLKINELKILQRASKIQNYSESKTIKEQLELLDKRLSRINKNINNLIVKASSSGFVNLNNLRQFKGTFINKFAEVGSILPTSDFIFKAIVSQEDSSYLFKNNLKEYSIKLKSNTMKTFYPSSIKIIPREQYKLPYEGLGFTKGGEIPINLSSDNILKTKEGFFMLHANFKDQDNSYLLYNKLGKIKIMLPPLTLLKRFSIYLSQLTQKRYKI